MTRPLSLLTTFAAAFLLAATTEAQKGKPPQEAPATIAFRCAFSTNPIDPCPGSGSVPDETAKPENAERHSRQQRQDERKD